MKRLFSANIIFFEKRKKPDRVSRSNSSESEEFFDPHCAGFALQSPQLETKKVGFSPIIIMSRFEIDENKMLFSRNVPLDEIR